MVVLIAKNYCKLPNFFEFYMQHFAPPLWKQLLMVFFLIPTYCPTYLIYTLISPINPYQKPLMFICFLQYLLSSTISK